MKLLFNRISFLSNPDFKHIKPNQFDSNLKSHLYFILTTGVIAGILTILINIGQVLFLDITRDISYNIANILNYSFNTFAGIFFFYLFMSTIGIAGIGFILSAITKKKYVQMLQILFFASTPMFLFGWILPILPGTIVWSCFLFYKGFEQLKHTTAKKNTIEQRE